MPVPGKFVVFVPVKANQVPELNTVPVAETGRLPGKVFRLNILKLVSGTAFRFAPDVVLPLDMEAVELKIS